MLAGLVLLTAGRARAFEATRAGYDTTQITSQDPVLAELFSMANDVGFRLGTWGGASRDFLLDKGAPPDFSDVDMVFDSSELFSALGSDGVLGVPKKLGRIAKAYWRILRMGGFKAVGRYTWLDRKQGGRTLTMSIHKFLESGGLTINQVGLMSDGSVWDPTGGLADAQARQLRYHAPKPIPMMVEDFETIHASSPYDVLRAIRFKAQYPEVEWAPGTVETLRQIMEQFPVDGSRTREVASYTEGVGGALRKVVPGPLRRPLSGLKSMLGKTSYKDLYPYIERGFDKLKKAELDSAEALYWVRELGVDRFVEAVGLGERVRELEAAAGGAVAPSVTRQVGAEPEPPATAQQAWERVRDQAYRNYLAAQEAGDEAAARAQFMIFQQASQHGGAP